MVVAPCGHVGKSLPRGWTARHPSVAIFPHVHRATLDLSAVAPGRARLGSQGSHLVIEHHLGPSDRVIATYPQGLLPDKNPTGIRAYPQNVKVGNT